MGWKQPLALSAVERGRELVSEGNNYRLNRTRQKKVMKCVFSALIFIVKSDYIMNADSAIYELEVNL